MPHVENGGDHPVQDDVCSVIIQRPVLGVGQSSRRGPATPALRRHRHTGLDCRGLSCALTDVQQHPGFYPRVVSSTVPSVTARNVSRCGQIALVVEDRGGVAQFPCLRATTAGNSFVSAEATQPRKSRTPSHLTGTRLSVCLVLGLTPT